MPQRPLESLGAIVRERRGRRKLREVAEEIGISPPTLMRVEAGRIPDLGTFGKICLWLEIDPREFLGTDKVEKQKETGKNTSGALTVAAHFKLDKTPNSKTVQALAEMLLLAAKVQPRSRED